METKIFLQEFGSKKSVNTSGGLNMSLSGKRKLLPTNDVAEVISQYDQYTSEREDCNIIRLTCQVNPICSNVLFNRVSEIVKDEGSSAVTYINYGIFSGKTVGGDYNPNISDKIRYKTRKMPFWSGNTMHYQTFDNDISNPSNINSEMSVIINTYSTNYGKQGSLENEDTYHPTNSIRDMQLSNDNYVYHCGLDIFNNHLIRSNTFKIICKCKNDDNGDKAEVNYNLSGYTAFNTIADLMRDVNGYKVAEKLPFPITAGVSNNAKFVTMHLYEYDDILPFEDCVKERLVSSYNGWIGFNNRPKMKSYDVFSAKISANETELEIERPIMYMNGGDFVDMYPDRSLYSFVPKFNHRRNRIEKNWNYCLTYPSSSTTEGFDDIIEASNNSLKTIYFDENTRADNGTYQLVMYSIAKHGLSVGDYVNIYSNTVTDSGEVINTKIIDNAKVNDVVDDYIFTVFNSDVQISKYWVEILDDRGNKLTSITLSIDGKDTTFMLDEKTNKYYYKNEDTDKSVKYYIVNDRYVNFDDNARNISYKKVVNDIECEYYIRIFSKIPNFKNASADTSNEYEIYKNNAEVIDTYQDHQYDFESHVSRLAFAKNIYTDEVGEVVFTDNIDISNLKDNLGRPLSSIFITFIKNNKGYKEWYGYDIKKDKTWVETEITADTVEYSHCFGRVICGIETSEESTCNKNISSIHSISINQNANDTATHPFGYNISLINGEREYGNYYISDYEVWFDTDKHYYGDLCYYDNYNAIERSIQPIMHRFNTAQRESSQAESNDHYKAFIYDEITKDDYDVGDKYEITANKYENANCKNEGYYYNPHYEIPIKTFDKLQTVMPDFLTMRSFINVDNGGNTYKITTLENHYLTIGDKTIIYDKVKEQYYYCTTISGASDTYKVFTCEICGENGEPIFLDDMYNSDEKLEDYKLFKMDNLGVPSYARVLRDGTCRIIWRNILNNGFNLSDKSVEEYPFTNGAFYVNKRIDIFVRRQDPFDIYGLMDDDLDGMEIVIENDNYVKDSDIVC